MPKVASSIFLGIVSILAFCWLGSIRDDWQRAWGDEGTFRAMAVSLAQDGDLLFSDQDGERLAALEDPGAKAVIIQTANGRVAYSKPPLFPLFAAPFVWLAGIPGLWIANLAALALASVVTWFALRRQSSKKAAWWLLVTFLGTSVLPAYIAWEMSEIFQLSLGLIGIALCSWAFTKPGDAQSLRRLQRQPEARTFLFLLAGGIALGLLTAARLPNALIAMGPGLALLLRRRTKSIAFLCSGFAAGLLVASLLASSMQGTWNPYKAQRTTYTEQIGYTSKARDVTLQFYAAPARQSMGLVPNFQPRVSAYSALYFLVGRHTGLLWYFPAAAILALLTLRRPEAESLALVAAALAIASFYILWWPTNYFGGATFLGNRYFLTAYPLLLFAGVRARRGFALLGLAWVVAAGVFVSALLSFNTLPSGSVHKSQSHAFAGIFRWLPYETTGTTIEGRQDKYWSGDFQRFVDPFATVSERAFTLNSDQPAAEVLLASFEPATKIVLRTRAITGSPVLVLDDGEKQQRFVLPPANSASPTNRPAQNLAGTPQVLHVSLPKAWRQHPFWFRQENFHARSLRFGVESATQDTAASALIQYGGSVERLDKLFQYDTLVVSGATTTNLPSEAIAGTSEVIKVHLRNTSAYPWALEDLFPVTLSYRVFTPSGDLVREGERQPLAKTIQPSWFVNAGEAEAESDSLDTELAIQWPTQPGTYRLEVDLVIDDYAWFADRLGHTVAEQTITLLPAAPEP